MYASRLFTPAAVSASGLAAAVAYANGGYALTATTPGDSLGHIITIGGLAITDHSAKTFTVTGTDPDGNSQSEGIAGPNGVATVSTTKYFLTVSSITVSATTGVDTFNLGWSAVSVTPTVGLNHYAVAPACISVNVTGTINFSAQETAESFRNKPQQNGFWQSITALAAKTSSTLANNSYSATCARALVNSVTAGATLRLVVAQAGG